MRRTYLLLFESRLRDKFTDRVPLQGMDKGAMSHVEKDCLLLLQMGYIEEKLWVWKCTNNRYYLREGANAV
jgi:hypothetical protein